MRYSFLAFLILFACSSKRNVVSEAVPSPISKPPIAFVNPFIGTDAHGHTYPGAVVPFGMVQLSPDTRLEGWDGCSGYHYSDSAIYGFSHSHLQGTGVSDLGDFLFMPTNGKTKKEDRWNEAYKSAFSHQNEKAEPGYYSVLLDDYQIRAELTCTERVGIHRYTLQPQDTCRLFIDFMHRDDLLYYDIVYYGDTAIAGYRVSKAWAEEQHAYFYAVFSQPVSEPEQLMAKEETIDPSTGKRTIAFEQLQLFSTLILPDAKNQPLLIKVGYSGVNIEGARKNLYAEAPHWNFDLYRENANKKWNAKLSTVKAPELWSDNELTKWYTAMYHCYTVPSLWSDVDGSYRGMDKQIHTTNGYKRYTVFSLWDTFRTYHPLMADLEPQVTRDWIVTFLEMYKERGELPVWELHANETYCMIGYHSIPVILDAYVKGIRQFDVELALEAMIKTANGPQEEKKMYRKLGYVPGDQFSESVSKTLEFAYDDWCIAEFARRIGKNETADEYFRYAQNWKNVFDPATHFMRARRNGGFAEPFDPFQVDFNYTEANAFQYSTFVPHDMANLARLMGGKDTLHLFLDRLFTAPTVTTGREQADITGLIGQYAHGNEPSHQMAFLYYHIAPKKADSLLRAISTHLYGSGADGLCGNEDCGQMSAWFVAANAGKFPICPGRLGNYPLQPDSSYTVVPFTEQLTKPITPVPIICGPALAFSTPTAISIQQAEPLAKTTITLKTATTEQTFEYQGPFLISENCTITASSKLADAYDSQEVKATFFRRDDKVQINQLSVFDNAYTGGGQDALIDGIRGGSDFRTGFWQGFQGKNVEAIIDLGELTDIKTINASCLQDIKSWIWFPSRIEFSVSKDGVIYNALSPTSAMGSEKEEGAQARTFSTAVPANLSSVRYIKMRAIPSFESIPEWHLGRGGKPWIFMDEIYFNR